jgi:hypothetical protein
MEKYSKLHVGDRLFDLRTGEFVGSITRLYRYWEKDPRYDDQLCVDYEYIRCDTGTSDNTSRQPNRKFGSSEDAKMFLEIKIGSMG